MVVLSEHDDELQFSDAVNLPSIGQCYGTFGELMQGILPDERHFLVTLPVNLKSIVEYEANELDTVKSDLRFKVKACQAVQDYLRKHGLPAGGLLHFRSTFPVGKGLASSSADMVASIRAAAHYYGLTPSPGIIESILRPIEPTDGVMYDGVVSFYHREVWLDERLGATPRLAIISVDRGGECDTIEFNKKKWSVSLSLRREYRDMLADMKLAIRKVDLRMIGAIASRSCELSQAFNPHTDYGMMRDLCMETDALGLVAAHSGTCIGLLYNQDDRERAAKTTHAQKKLRTHGVDWNQYLAV